jgi:tRNA(Ile)-lysidine synthetase-like protein
VRVLVRELGATDNLAAVAVQARAQWPLLERAIDEAERAHADVAAHETRFASWPDDAWLRAAILRRHIRRLDPEARDFDAHRIANELASIRRTSITKTLELVRQGETLVLRKRPEETPQFEIELTENAAVYIPEIGKSIRLAAHRGQPTTDKRQRFQLPDDIRATFLVRNRRTGDRFHPLGMPSAKKLKDFLIDRKIPAEVRDRLPLLLCNDEIVWVAGVEISERFKVTASGGAIYEVSMEDSGAPNHDDHSGLQR